ncbi:sensor histidine kinase [Nakamurella lactea]|uniref:sensor histidine kinase n=1 Tax=Nakamurella lactea TaxID=459515 RepID=UPI0004071AD6|nr:HAMP domain-containing sensor histidine kinase [Nakamurella lactea]
MSSNPSDPQHDPDATGPIEIRQPPRRHRPMTLRSKLIAGFVVAIIAVSAVIGIVTQVFLSDYLLKQLDSRVLATQVRFGGPPPGEQPDTGTTQSNGRFRNLESGLCTETSASAGRINPQPDDSIVGVIVDGAVSTAALRSAYPSCTQLTAAQAAPLTTIAPDQPPVTVSLNDFGTFRVVATAMPDNRVIVTGLSTADVSATQNRLTVIMLIVAGSAVVIGGVTIWLIVRRSLRPLERVAATARKVTTLPLDRGEVDLGIRVPARDTDPRTEIGQVGAALNQMLGHVSEALSARHESETQVRRFVADASHELRTPLAAIRGYAELAGRNPDDAAGVTHSLARVHSESERMSSLVDDLLLLARLDAGRPLDHDPVDLTALAIDVVSDARVAGPDHHWRLELPPEPIVVRGDGARLHQLLANLLANARTHTPPGCTVVTGLRTERAMAVLTVTDDGPGIDPALQPGIFGRFVRGDQSRSRAAGSTGLGLAIVAAVTAAHDGTVAVNSHPGRTTFTVRLPLDAESTD